MECSFSGLLREEFLLIQDFPIWSMGLAPSALNWSNASGPCHYIFWKGWTSLQSATGFKVSTDNCKFTIGISAINLMASEYSSCRTLELRIDCKITYLVHRPSPHSNGVSFLTQKWEHLFGHYYRKHVEEVMLILWLKWAKYRFLDTWETAYSWIKEFNRSVEFPLFCKLGRKWGLSKAKPIMEFVISVLLLHFNLKDQMCKPDGSHWQTYGRNTL